MGAFNLLLRHKACSKRSPNATLDSSPTSPIGMEILSNELLCMIIGYLDPLSAVCLALTSGRLYHCVLDFTRCDRLDDICPKDYYQLPSPHLRLYFHDLSLPHYRSPLKILEYANSFGISRARFNPAYIQLLLCLRGFMAPSYVFCFASAAVRYVPRKGKHVCDACQSERRYLAEDDLHEFSGELMSHWRDCPRRRVVAAVGRILKCMGCRG